MTTALVDQREISKELDHEDQSTDRESIGVSHRAVDVKDARSCPAAGRQAQHIGEFGKNRLGDNVEALPTAHGFQEFWGYLYHLDAMQGVSFPDINKSPTVQGVAPPCKSTPVPGLSEVQGAVDPRTSTCLT